MLRFLFCFLLAAASGGAHAFASRGHMAVGAIADELLRGTRAGAEVNVLLGAGGLRAASVWADCVRGVRDDTGRYTIDPRRSYPECAPFEDAAGIAQMEDFVRRNRGRCPSRQPRPEVCHKQYHYANLAWQRDAYSPTATGAAPHDIVGATGAAIAVLQGRPAPAPFSIRGRQEALRLIAHYMGDIHQPLHLGTVYLDRRGRVLDPDAAGYNPQSDTRGSNRLLAGPDNLHAMWDDVPATLAARELLRTALREARAVPPTAGPVTAWPALWAGETLREAQRAFRELRYGGETKNGAHRVRLPPGYAAMKENIQRRQIVRAGARLAEVLRTVWP